MAVLSRIPTPRRKRAAGIARGVATILGGYLSGREARQQREREREERRQIREAEARAERAASLAEERAELAQQSREAEQERQEAIREIRAQVPGLDDDQIEDLLANPENLDRVTAQAPMGPLEKARLESLLLTIEKKKRDLRSAPEAGAAEAGAVEERAADELERTLLSQNIADRPPSFDVILDTAVEKTIRGGWFGMGGSPEIETEKQFGEVVLRFGKSLAGKFEMVSEPSGLAMSPRAVSAPSVQRAIGIFVLRNAPIDPALRKILEGRYYGNEVTDPALSEILDLEG